MSDIVERCRKTTKPCGTDTFMEGAVPCDCPPCVRWYVAEIERLRREKSDWVQLANMRSRALRAIISPMVLDERQRAWVLHEDAIEYIDDKSIRDLFRELASGREATDD